MKTIMARVVDATHLELSEPIAVPQGDMVSIAIPDDEDAAWKELAATQMLAAYAEEDAVYDQL